MGPFLYPTTIARSTFRPWLLTRHRAVCFSPRAPVLAARASYSTKSETGDNSSGHLEAGPNEGILFIDNVYPLKLRWLLRFSFYRDDMLARLHNSSIAGVNVQEVIRKAMPDTSVNVEDIIPRLREGGAFVRFRHSTLEPGPEVESAVRAYLHNKSVKPWWNPFHHVQAHLVRGRPWVEDLYRPPSCRLRVEFQPAGDNAEATALSEEHLYSLFRPYGKLREIESQPSDSKVLPKYALLEYGEKKPAIMAKNCLHGLTARNEDTKAVLAKIMISYERSRKGNWFFDWIGSHPRIVIPVLAALATAFTVAVFDPIRTFSVKTHITRAFHVTDNRLYKWLVSRARNVLTMYRSRSSDLGMDIIWDDRKEAIEQIQRWLMESSDTFIVVQGPRGAGKKELVWDQALKFRNNKLIIDCKPLQESRSDSAVINSMASEVGYRPVFSWMNSISGLIDLAAQGATGVKTGFSETADTQIANVLNTTAAALKEIGLENRPKDPKDADMSDDTYLEAHPESRPVVVIDNFLHKSQEGTSIHDKLAEWAAQITTANIAHVIFLTTDVSFSKALSKALPDRVFRELSLGDCGPETAKRFVISHLEAEPSELQSNAGEEQLSVTERRKDLTELDSCISYLGGRLTDLEFLARRIRSGEAPIDAVNEIIEQSASEVLKMYILVSIGDASASQWTPEQAWTLVQKLAKTDAVRYNEAVLAIGGKDPDAVMQALQQAELISITAVNGRPYSIKPGKPVYQHAFQKLLEDKVLNARLQLAIVNGQIKDLNATIDKSENELGLIGTLPNRPSELNTRVYYLLNKIRDSQASIEKLEAQAGGLKKVLMTEY